MAKAMRSLIEPPGLPRSDLIQTLALAPNRRLMRMCGRVANGLQNVVGFHGGSKEVVQSMVRIVAQSFLLATI